MPIFRDQTGQELQLDAIPRRVVSLVPSQSEFLWDLGLREDLVGITKFCIHPDTMFRELKKVGGTKQLDLKTIRSLKPDLIIGNKEENTRDQIFSLQREFPVWMSDIYTFEDAFGMMRELGEILGKQSKAVELVEEIQKSMAPAKNKFSGQRVVYFIWNSPYMVAAKNTFIDEVLRFVGLTNAAEHLQRYPVIDPAGLQQLNPDVCFLSSEPFPFKQKHVSELQDLLPNATIKIVDGELFSWYGSRLRFLGDYVCKSLV